MSEVKVSISVELGPITIKYESGPGDELIWCDESEFTEKVLELRKYFGDPRNPGENPNPPPPQAFSVEEPTTWQPSSTTPPWLQKLATEGQDQPQHSFGMETSDETFDDEDLYGDDDDTGEIPQGKRVARVAGTQFSGRVDGEKG